MEYQTSIKIHDPCRAGVLVELSGEFDVSCLDALGHALNRALSFGRPTFVDLSGVTFMDALCVGELANRSKAGDLRLSRPSWQAELSMTACGLKESVAIPPDDPGYEAVISEVCGCKRTRCTGETMALFLLAPRARTSATPQEAGAATRSTGSGALLRNPQFLLKVDQMPEGQTTGAEADLAGRSKSEHQRPIDGRDGDRNVNKLTAKEEVRGAD